MSPRALITTAVALLAMAGAAHAQSGITSGVAPASAALVIRDGVQISTLQKTTVATDQMSITPTAQSMIDAIAVIQISGDPDRAYRIRLPHFVNAEGHALVEALSAHSESTGEVDNESSVATNGDGRDVIQLKGRLRVSDGSGAAATTMPLSVDVE